MDSKESKESLLIHTVSRLDSQDLDDVLGFNEQDHHQHHHHHREHHNSHHR
jgi:hypothetical protein